MSIRPELSIGAVVVHDGSLLLVRRGHGPAAGQWSVPGGRIEWGETIAEAVVRELREETGLEGVCGEMLGWVEIIDDDHDAPDHPVVEHHFVVLDFVATVLEHGEPIAGDDAAEVRWVPLADVLDLNIVDGLPEFLHEHGILDAFT